MQELCRLAQEETRLFLTVCTYAYECMDVQLIPDAWWDRGMYDLMPELAFTGMWIHDVTNHEELEGYARQIHAIMVKHRRKEALHTMLFSPEVWK